MFFVEITYVSFWMELDEEAFPLEAELAYLGPGEGVDLGVVLEDQGALVGDGQVELDVLVVLGGVEAHPVHLQPPRHVQEVEVGVGHRLTTGERERERINMS